MLTTLRCGGYEALRLGAAWRDLSSRGRLRATGEDRARLIHAIASNAVEGLHPGHGTYAFFLSPQGRIQADSHIFVDRDHLLIDSESSAAAVLREHIDSYVIMDDVTLEDIAPQTALLALAGPGSGAIVTGMGLNATERTLTFARSGNICVFRSPMPGVGYWIMAPYTEKAELAAAMQALGAVESTGEEWEAHRVLNWLPRFGIDYGSKNIPHETRQFNAVSFSKGCYTGQEIVERVRSRGRVRRQLVGIELEAPELPDTLTIRHEGNAVGELTSPTSALAPATKARGFAIVRSAAAAPGTAVHVGPTPGRIVDVSRH